MLATAVGVDAGVEGDIRALVVADDGLGEVAQELGFGRGRLVGGPILVAFEAEFLEAVGRIKPGATAVRRWLLRCHQGNDRRGREVCKSRRRKKRRSAAVLGRRERRWQAGLS